MAFGPFYISDDQRQHSFGLLTPFSPQKYSIFINVKYLDGPNVSPRNQRHAEMLQLHGFSDFYIPIYTANSSFITHQEEIARLNDDLEKARVQLSTSEAKHQVEVARLHDDLEKARAPFSTFEFDDIDSLMAELDTSTLFASTQTG